MITTKLTGRENLTKYAFWWGPGGPTDKETKLRCIKSNLLGTLRLQNCKDPDLMKQSDPDQMEKQDQDPYQSEKQDPDPYKTSLDPQHC
jgi:hypothetical protein